MLRRVRPSRRASRRHRFLKLEKLECRANPAIFPFTVSLPAFHVFEDPDPDPFIGADDEGDYYAIVKIGNNPEQFGPIVTNGETLKDVNWSFTANVDTAAGNLVQVNIYLMDEDDSFLGVRGDDDEIDINPRSDALGITLFVDRTTGRWTGDAPFPADSSTGDDDDDEGAERGQLFFDFDSDSDGLNNRWEILGIDSDRSGSIDLTLPGAHPARHDLYVEVDAMQDATMARAPIPLPGISTATASSPIVITANGHGLTTGTPVTIAGVQGNTAANGTFTVTRINDNQFSLDGSAPSGFHVPNTGSYSLASLAGTGLATNTSLDLVIDSFLRAPVPNPDGSTGIRLHVALDEVSLPGQSWDQNFDGDALGPYGEDRNANGLLDVGEDVAPANGTLDPGDADDQLGGTAFRNFVQTFRNNQFGTAAERGNVALMAAKNLAYRYCVFADRRVDSQSPNPGVSVSSSGVALAADYFLVTLGTINGGQAVDQSATFMHELGHTLLLRHGGGDGINNKPNYYSNMNYTWQFPFRANANMDASWKLDWSIGNLAPLNETSLNETVGFGGQVGRFTQIGPNIPAPPGSPPGTAPTQRVVSMSGPVDWNNLDSDGSGNRSDDGDLNPPTDIAVSADINFDNQIMAAPMVDYNDWVNLGYGIAAARPRFTAIFGGSSHEDFTLDDWMDRNQALYYVIPHGNGADRLTLRLSGGNVEVVNDATGQVVARRSLATTRLIEIVGADGEDDQLTFDFGGGNPIPSDGLRFAGGAFGATDRLVLRGTLPATPVYTPEVAGTSGGGVLALGSSQIAFSGLEFVQPVAPRVTTANVSPDTVDENQTVLLNVQFVDPGSSSTHSVRIDWGDGGPAEIFSISLGQRSFTRSHKYLDDNPTGTSFDINSVAVTITDNDSLAGNASPTVRVNNVAPLLQNVALTSAIDENGTVTLSGRIVDPGTLDTFSLVVNWGEGTPQTFTYPAGTTEFSETHQYLDDDPTGTPQDEYSISLTLTDDDTGTATAGLTTLVRNVDPVINAFTSDAVECGDKVEGDTVNVVGSFTDVGTLDTHTAVINWGDNSPPTAATIVESGGSGTITGSHIYSSGGIFRIVVTLTDDDTGQTTDRTFALITGIGILDGQLQVVGTKGVDDVLINLLGSGKFQAHATFIADSPRSLSADGVESIAMILCSGNDRATVAGNIFLPTYIAGQEGDDVLNGGGGPNILLGGEGHDDIRGGSGHDILVGGSGADRIVGNNGRDILIAGELGGQADPIEQLDDFRSLLDEWALYIDPTRTRRRLIISGDDDADSLTGSADADWFFFELGEDKAADAKNELSENLG